LSSPAAASSKQQAACGPGPRSVVAVRCAPSSSPSFREAGDGPRLVLMAAKNPQGANDEREPIHFRTCPQTSLIAFLRKRTTNSAQPILPCRRRRRPQSANFAQARERKQGNREQKLRGGWLRGATWRDHEPERAEARRDRVAVVEVVEMVPLQRGVEGPLMARSLDPC
jgi:hypothetical protein